jgi:hypothetical protein
VQICYIFLRPPGAQIAKSASSFRTPRGCAVPFGVMELTIEAAGKKAEFDKLVAALDKADPASAELQKACEALQALVSAVRPPDSLLKQVWH